MKNILEILFPKSIDNQYRGNAILTVGRSLAHMFLPDGGAQSIATIPLEAFPPSAASGIIGLFAYWGLSQLLFGFLFVLVLWRYQSLIPLMWLFISIEWTGRLLLGFYKPSETVGTAPGAVGNHVIPVLALIMLAWSLWSGMKATKE